MKKKVFVGLSGGVDSAVSAALLKKEGYDVTGVFIKAWDPNRDRLAPRSFSGVGCAWRQDRRSAMRVAAILDIPFITLDLEKEYKKEVVDYMIAEYKKGRTPNPDVICNKKIKFGHFLKFALDNGANFVATGHYCQTSSPTLLLSKEKGEERKNDKLEVAVPPLLDKERGLGGEVVLLEGADKNKDQSYFLWTLTQVQLEHTLFPIGHLQKSEVRKLAEKFGLPQAERKDSQGVCFLGQIDMKDFLKEYISAKRGKVLNEKGEAIGEHDGAILYTIGERHGFIVNKKTDKEGPLYVVAKNVEGNTITVANQHFGRPSKMLTETVLLSDTNFVGKILNKKLLCRIRYRQEKVKCKIEIKRNEVKVIFNKPQIGVSPGQSLVLYDKEVCLGGGVIG